MGEIEQHEKEIYFEVAGIKNPERQTAYLKLACGGDHELRDRVQALLNANAVAGTFLDSPPVESVLNSYKRDAESSTAAIDDRHVGSYKLLEKIGEGGFGEVYMAEQLRPMQRRVAIKIIKLGMDSNQFIARFEAERQALALMDHPNIARIFDAGETENGRPYFAMELVRGVPITEYCDNGNLSTDERLQLFVEICSAVQHAHQKGIIHRDIKPTNILVFNNGDRATPKVIDFGIAKATQGRLTNKTLFTQFRQLVGTPAYMSPEQAQMSGVDIDTRSDIYSLGVLLYELVTGRTPLDSHELQKAGFDELCRRVREDEAPQPSLRLSSLTHEERTTVARNRCTDPSRLFTEVRGDLDWIIMKAVEKDRVRRYSTAESFAQDIQRHLDGSAVTAAPPTARYLLKKFAQRNRRLLATTALVAASLVAVTVVSVWAAFDSHRNQRLIEQESNNTDLALANAITAKNESEEERQRANRISYASDMIGAYQALQLNNLGLARTLLQRHADDSATPHLRNWEWRALSLLCEGDSLETLVGYATQRWTLCDGEFGNWLVAKGNDGIEIRELITGKVVKKIEAGQLSNVAYCQSKHLLCVAERVAEGKRRNIRAWSLPSFRKLPWAISVDGKVIEMQFSHDGSRLALLSDAGVSVFSLEGPEPIQLASDDVGIEHHGAIDFSPDGRWLALARGGEIWLCDPDTMGQQHVIPYAGKYDVEFSPDGTMLACAANITETSVALLRVPTGKPVGFLRGHTRYVQDVAWSPDGEKLASASSDHTIRLWDVDALMEDQVLLGHTGEIYKLAFSADGTYVVSGGTSKLDDRKTEICIWSGEGKRDVGWPRTKHVMGYGDWHRQYSVLSCSHDMKWLATRNKAEPLPTTHDNDARAENKTIMSASLRHPTTLEEIVRLTTNEDVWGVRFSPVSDLLAIGETNGRLTLLRAETPDPKTRLQLKPSGLVSPVGFSADGKSLLVVLREQDETSCFVISVKAHLSSQPTLRSWVLPEKDLSAAISPDGQSVVAGHEDGIIRIWSVLDPAMLREVSAYGSGVAYSPDGKYIATDECLLDAETGHIVRRMRGHKMGVHSVAFSRDGRRIITGGGGRREAVKIWDVATGQELMTLSTREPGFSFRHIEFSTDANSIYAVGGNHALSVWQLPANSD